MHGNDSTQLNKNGLEEYLKIYQESYDAKYKK